MKKRKILFVIDSLASGGAEKSLVSLLGLIDYGRYDVDLLMFAPRGLYLELLPSQVNVIAPAPAAEPGGRPGFRALLRRAAASCAIRNPYARRKYHTAQLMWRWTADRLQGPGTLYDVAIAYSQGMPTYYVAEKVNAAKKLAWVNTDYRKANYNRDFDARYYAEFRHVVAVSEIAREIFGRSFPDRSECTRVVYDIVSPGLIRSMARRPGGFDDGYDGLRILTIGRLVPAKGYDLALAACRRLTERGLRFRWYIIGEGLLRDKLAREAAGLGLGDRVVFLGTHANPYPFLAQCDVYAQPSRFEGFGLAIAEAKILDRPIVATDFDVVHGQLEDGVNGLIVGMDGGEIADAILRLAEDETLRRRLQANLRAERHGTEDELHKIVQLIES